MNRVVLVFGNKWNVLQTARRLGYSPYLIHAEASADADNWLQVAFDDDSPQTIARCESFRRENPIGIIVCSEFYVELAAQVRHRFFPHLRGLSIEQAAIVRDKLRLKHFLAELAIPTAAFVALDEATRFEMIRETLNLPFVIKPRKGVLARGITMIHSARDWETWRQPQTTISDFYVEAYVQQARECCCDTIVSRGEIVCQFPGEYTVTCLESNQKHDGYGVNFPGFFPSTELDSMKQLAQRFIHGLRIDDGFCHIEFLHDAHGWKFGECGCRLPGGYQIPTESYLSQSNVIEDYIKIFCEETSLLGRITQPQQFYGYYLYPKKTGRVKKITAQFDPPWVVEHKIYVQEGQEVLFENSSVAMSAHVVYRAKDIEELRSLAAIAPTLLQIEYA